MDSVWYVFRHPRRALDDLRRLRGNIDKLRGDMEILNERCKELEDYAIQVEAYKNEIKEIEEFLRRTEEWKEKQLNKLDRARRQYALEKEAMRSDWDKERSEICEIYEKKLAEQKSLMMRQINDLKEKIDKNYKKEKGNTYQKTLFFDNDNGGNKKGAESKSEEDNTVLQKKSDVAHKQSSDDETEWLMPLPPNLR